MTATATEPVSDQEVRDWAKATGRTVGQKGPLPASLRAEYEAMRSELVDALPSGDGQQREPAPSGQAPAAEPADDAPAAAREEKRPRRTAPARKPGIAGRLRAWAAGDTEQPRKPGRPAKAGGTPRAAKPRVSVVKLIERGWENIARVAMRVNPPMGRCMDWQSAYAGIVFEDAIRGTVVDKLLQPLARAEDKLSGVGSLVAMPLIVGALQMPANQPDNPAGTVKHQMLIAALEECIDVQLEMLGDSALASRLAERAEARASRQAEIDKIIALIFQPPAGPEQPAQPPPTPDQYAAQREAAVRAQEALRAQAAAGGAPAFVPPAFVPENRRTQPPAGPRKPRQVLGNDGKLHPES